MLTADEQVVKVEVAIDGVFLSQIILENFTDFKIRLDSLEIGTGTEIMVYAYDKYLNHTARSATLMSADPVVDDPGNTCAIIGITPNPFCDKTTITLNLAEKGLVRLAIFDLRGNLIKVLIEQDLPPGSYAVTWDGASQDGLLIPAGSYLCSMSINNRRTGVVKILHIQ
jgi:hypothetical protein